MKFSALVAIVPDDLEPDTIAAARQAGACGITLMSARGIGTEEKKSFFGLTFEGSQSVLLIVLERRLSLRVLKSIRTLLMDDDDSRGVVFSCPIEHIAGLDLTQVHRFEAQIEDQL